MIETIKIDAAKAITELCEKAKIKKGQIIVIGCSSSEVAGYNLGSCSSPEIGKAIFEGIFEVLSKKEVFLAAQCCEHLNRAIIIERKAANGFEIVNVLPKIKAGGSFATAAYNAFSDPVAVEEIKADAGLDIGGTLIGMHLKKVAVPLRLDVKHIGSAPVNAARTRPKFIGGQRTCYDENIM